MQTNETTTHYPLTELEEWGREVYLLHTEEMGIAYLKCRSISASGLTIGGTEPLSRYNTMGG